MAKLRGVRSGAANSSESTADNTGGSTGQWNPQQGLDCGAFMITSVSGILQKFIKYMDLSAQRKIKHVD